MINTQILALITQPELNQQIYQQALLSLKQKYLISSKIKNLREIDHLAQKLNEKINKGEPALKESYMKGKMEIWAFGELKIFQTVCLVRSLLISVQLQHFTEAEYIYLNKIFLKRTNHFLKYELASLLKCRVKNNIQWMKAQIQIFTKIVEEDEDFYNSDPYKVDNFQWKFYSFQLFTRSKGKYYRTLQQCREKWINYLNPELSHAPWNIQEDIRLFQLIGEMGFKWAGISKAFGMKRTEHMVKNRFNSMIKVWKNKNLKSIPAEEISKKVLTLLEEKAAKGAQLEKRQILQLLNLQSEKSTQKNFSAESNNLESLESSCKQKKDEEMLNEKMEFNVQDIKDEQRIVEEAPQNRPTIHDWNRHFESVTKRLTIIEKEQKKTRDDQEFDQPNLNIFKLNANNSGVQELDLIEIQGLSAFKIDLQSDKNFEGSVGQKQGSNQFKQILRYDQFQRQQSWMIKLQEKDMLFWID